MPQLSFYSCLLNSPLAKDMQENLKILGSVVTLENYLMSVISAHIVHFSFFHLVKGRSLFTSVIGYRTKPITDSGKAKCPPQENSY